MKRVGIVGGGPAGLCAVRHVLSTPGFEPIAWERTSDVGGTWVHNPCVGEDQNGFPIHSSMYDNMRTNLPKEIMQFPDYPFKENGSSYIHHTEVLQYLKDYTKFHKISDSIKFSHHVELIKPVEDSEQWEVTVKYLKTDTIHKEICDALIICNGHYSVPRSPKIPNMDEYKGTCIHSHDYRNPSLYAGKTVVLLGAGHSGIDILLDIATVAKKVYLSHNQVAKIQSKLPNNVVQVAGIKEASRNGFILNDDSFIEVDSLIFCTGYEFTYPFLSSSCGISVVDGVVSPLYKHFININHPSMAIIGIPFRVIPFPLFDVQVRFILKTIIDPHILPSLKQRIEERNKDYAEHMSKGYFNRHFHHLRGELQAAYHEKLCKCGEIEPVSDIVFKINDSVRLDRVKDVAHYKQLNYKITESDCFEVSMGQ